MSLLSAIYYPDVEISSEATMRTALLMWDEIKVIVPDEYVTPNYTSSDMQKAWELIGGKMVPDKAQQLSADGAIRELLESPEIIMPLYRDDAPYDVYEIWPQKLLPETWMFLQENMLTSTPLANGDYPLAEQSAYVIMAKLADACAGNVFARCTDRFLAYGLTPDLATAEDSFLTTVVPMTLSVIDAANIPLGDLIAFRQNELKANDGSDYRKWRHKYAAYLTDFVETTKTLSSENQLKECRRQLEEDVQEHLTALKGELSFNKTDTLTKSAIVTAVVGSASWLAGHHAAELLSTALFGGMISEATKSVVELLRTRNSYSHKQRKVLEENPMAYLYQLGRAV